MRNFRNSLGLVISPEIMVLFTYCSLLAREYGSKLFSSAADSGFVTALCDHQRHWDPERLSLIEVPNSGLSVCKAQAMTKTFSFLHTYYHLDLLFLVLSPRLRLRVHGENINQDREEDPFGAPYTFGSHHCWACQPNGKHLGVFAWWLSLLIRMVLVHVQGSQGMLGN